MAFNILVDSEVSQLVTHTRIDANISQAVRKEIEASGKELSSRDYFFVTDIVNPIFCYWSRYNDIPTPPDIRRKLNYGSYVHYVSRFWFEKMPGFVYSEANLVGSYVGLSGISGKIDYQINNSIVEFKTKERPVDGIDDVLDNFPQDLEQLLSYVAMSSSVGNEHYLVFTSESNSQQITLKAFKVKVNDLPGIRKLINNRRNSLETALKEKKPEILPRCRYFVEGCKFRTAKICNCESLTGESARSCLKYIEILEDSALANKLNNSRSEYVRKPEERDLIGIWDVIFPMKKYHRHFEYALDEDYEQEKSYIKEAMKVTISSAVIKSGFGITGRELEILREQHLLGFEDKYTYMRINVPSISKEAIPVPYTVKVTASMKVFSAQKLPNIYGAQAVLMAVDSGSRCSVLLVYFPNSNNDISAYVIFPNKAKVAKAVEYTKKAIQNSFKIGSPSDLARCPDWIKENCEFNSCFCQVSP